MFTFRTAWLLCGARLQRSAFDRRAATRQRVWGSHFSRRMSAWREGTRHSISFPDVWPGRGRCWEAARDTAARSPLAAGPSPS